MSFLIPSDVKVYLYLAPCDMRKSINTLSILVADTLKLDPASGHLFLFRSRSKDKMKALHYSQNCFTLLYRRCEQGKFIFPVEQEGVIELTQEHFDWILSSHQYQQVNTLTPNHYSAFH